MSHHSTSPPASPVAQLTVSRWAIAISIPLCVALLTAWAGLDSRMVTFCALTVAALSIWALELLPDAMVATALPVLFIVTKVGPPQKILGPWTSSMGWLILGGLMIGAFMMKTGLARRLALRSINIMGGSFNRLLWGILLAGMVMAPFIPSVLGRAAILAVICIGICEALNLQKGSNEGSSIMLAGFVAVAGPKLAYLTGGGDLVMGMKLAGQAMGYNVSWMQYALHNFLPATLYSGLSILCIIFVMRPHIDVDIRSVVAAQINKLGIMSTDERKAMCLLVALLLLLMTDKLHGIDVGWIMLLLPCVAFLPGVNLLNGQDFGKLPMSSVLFVVGCMTIGSAAVACGMDKLISTSLLPLLGGSELYTVMSTYAAGAVLNLLLTPISAYAALTTSVVEIGQHLGVNPLLMVYAYSYGLEQYIFPYEYAILLYFYATGYSKMSHIMKVFGLRMVVASLFVAFVAYPYWKFIL